MPEFDMDTNQSDTHESLDKGMQLFKELEQYLEDALELLTEQERRQYDLFCNAANLKTFNEERTIGKKTTDLPSAKNYRTGLIEELHARTKRVSDNAVQERCASPARRTKIPRKNAYENG